MKRISLLGLFAAMLATAVVVPARADDSGIAQFVGKQTDAVVHVDMTKVDLDALNTWYKKALDNSSLDATKKDKAKADADKNLGQGKDWIAKFTKAGGKDLYIVVQLSGLMTGEPGAIVVPLADGANADELAKILNPAGNPPPADDPNDRSAAQHGATAVVGKNLLFAPSSFLTKLKSATGDPRPDLTDALAVGGDAPGHLAVAGQGFQGAAAMVARGNMGVVGDPAFKNVLWSGVSLALPPQGAAHVTMQTKDADSASALVTAINNHIAAMKNDPKAKENLGDNVDKVADALKPTTDGTKVSVSFTEETLDAILPSMIAKMDKDQSRQPAPGPDGAPGGAPDNGPPMQ